jgi:hypothetical protein
MVGGTPVAAQPIGAHESRSAPEQTTEEEALEAVHRPKHGGYFGDAEDLFHYEVLREAPGKLLLYVNDERNRPLDVRTLQGQWVARPDDPDAVSGAFVPSADGERFEATLPDGEAQQEVLTVKVEVLRGNEWVGMEFALPVGPVPAERRPGA